MKANSLCLGALKLKSNLILAPLAGISDLPFRRLNRAFGCELAFTEMLNVRSLSHKSKKTMQMLSTDSLDRPLGVQILGCEEKYIIKGLDVLSKYRFDILDFNAACPVRKVVRRGEGAGLLRNPKKLAKLLKLVVRRCRVPVSVKIRSGWDRDSVNAKDVALLCEDAGASALFIHGRTKEQIYSGAVDYKIIGMVKKAVGIAVIASGDILSPQLSARMLKETGCDGLVIARGSLGNPWIFKQVNSYLKNGEIIPMPSKDEIIRTMLLHLGLCVDFYAQRVGVMIFRKFFAWYTKGFRKVRQLREISSRARTKDEMIAIIKACAGGINEKSPLATGIIHR